MLVFDRSDDLQDRYLEQWGAPSHRGRRHYIPSSPDFAEAVRLGLGWAVLPRQQSLLLEAAGELVDLSSELGRPGTGVDVTLHWQQWSVRTAAMNDLTSAIVSAATKNLN